MEEDKVSEEFVKGFNHGYTLNEYKPELYASLEKTQSKSEYFEGLRAGGAEYEMSKEKNPENVKKKDVDIGRE